MNNKIFAGIFLSLLILGTGLSNNDNGMVSAEPGTGINPEYVTEFGNFGTSDGQFDAPNDITVNSTHILVADTSNHRIQIFDLSGEFKAGFGSYGTGDGQFDAPTGVAINSTHILVTDTSNNRVQIFDLSGEFKAEFGSYGTSDGQFSSPKRVDVNGDHIFVVDTNNDRVQIFDLGGHFKIKFGSSGTGDGQFTTPRGITVNSTHIFVVDTFNYRIQIFKKIFAPQNLIADVPDVEIIALSWEAPIETAPISYRLYRGLQSDDLSMLADTTDTSFIDDIVLEDQLYYYGVTAVYSTGESMLSNIVSAEMIAPVTVTETSTETETETSTETETNNYSTTETITETNTEVQYNTSTVTQENTITEFITSLPENITELLSSTGDLPFSGPLAVVTLGIMVAIIRRKKK